MKIADAKAQFILDWGILAGNWGLSRTIGHVHGLLLVSPKPLATDDIMSELSISRGNCNGTVRELIQWGVVSKTFLPGQRKEYFQAEKDIWKVAQLVARERKRRELDPLAAALAKYHKLEGPKQEVKEFQDLLSSMQTISDMASRALELLGKSGLLGFLKGFQ